MGSVQTQIDYPRGLDFEQVWAALMENRELQKETDRQMKETALQLKETDRLIKEVRENQKETDRILSEKAAMLNAQIGSLTNLFGDFTLGMVVPKLCEKFLDFGFVFSKSSPNVEINDKKNDISLEIDILLENSDKAMLVEVKTKLTKERVNKHIERLEKMRKYANLHGDKRTFIGAVAGFAITEEVKKTALEEGFYLIEPDGENFNIVPPNGNLKEW
jgi:hypothetical protein